MHSEESSNVSRRRFLQAASATATTAAVAGQATAQEGTSGEPDYGGWFSDATGGATDNYSSTVDRRDADSVTVEVGAEGNGGTFAFEPAAVRISPGTTVNFEWTSNTHNVIPESIPDGAEWEGTPGGESETYDTGHTYDHTFETEGIYTYYCQPHLGLGMKGAIVVGDVGAGGDGSGEESGDAAEGSSTVLPDSAKAMGVGGAGAMVGTLGLAYVFLKYSGTGGN
ncbi:MAG: halocyanin domain-containing protein [Halobacteriales archaeon]